jgi:hypothetical protein
MGEMVMPADIGEQAEKYNVNILRKLLNEGSCFDLEIQHQENDVLNLYFTYKQKKPISFCLYGDFLVYAFLYKKGKWKKTSYDPFDNNVSKIQTGKISTPFANLIG